MSLSASAPSIGPKILRQWMLDTSKVSLVERAETNWTCQITEALF